MVCNVLAPKGSIERLGLIFQEMVWFVFHPVCCLFSPFTSMVHTDPLDKIWDKITSIH
jgi:hypothetical protein